MHTHHSHSGQFCQHAKRTLEEMVQTAISKNLSLICLTEHMPRYMQSHLYPEEIESNTSVLDLEQTFQKFITEARALQLKYEDSIDILVGFETEGMNKEYFTKIVELRKQYNVDLIVGSVHHVNECPIDFDQGLWNQACEKEGGIEQLFYNYFKTLKEFFTVVKPEVIGHLDLIRLYAPDFELSSRIVELVHEIIDLGVKGNCLFELNSSAIRKGWSTPYPKVDIASTIKSRGGKFCLSDDSHDLYQIALNYHVVLQYLENLGVHDIYRLESGGGHKKVPVTEFKKWVDQNMESVQSK